MKVVQYLIQLSSNMHTYCCKRADAAFKLSYLIVEPVVFRSIPATVESWVLDQADTVKTEEKEEEEEEVEDGNTDDLYSHIHQLSEKIKHELTFRGQAMGCDAPLWVEPEGADTAAVANQTSPSKKRVDADERLQKAIEKMVTLDTRLLELVKVSYVQVGNHDILGPYDQLCVEQQIVLIFGCICSLHSILSMHCLLDHWHTCMGQCPAKSPLLYFFKFFRTSKRKVMVTLKCMANYKFSAL